MKIRAGRRSKYRSRPPKPLEKKSGSNGLALNLCETPLTAVDKICAGRSVCQCQADRATKTAFLKLGERRVVQRREDVMRCVWANGAYRQSTAMKTVSSDQDRFLRSSTFPAVERSFKFSGNEGVTLARRRFQALANRDGNLPAAVADQPGLLKREAGQVHARPPNTEHLCEKLLRQRKLVAVHAIMRHQQPAG